MKKVNYTRLFIHIVFVLFCMVCIIPLVAIIMISLTKESSISQVGYSLFPKEFDLTGYIYVLNNPKQIFSAYKISFFVSIFGTIASLLVISGLAYAISLPDFKFKKQISFIVFFTMLFNGGLVPWYILISNILQLKNNVLALILPYMVIPWFVFLLRTFMQTIPGEIIESCRIDGSSEYGIFFKMILPLSKPGLATIGLFIILNYWNDWWLSLLFIEKEKFIPLQYMLYRIMNAIEFLTNSSNKLPPGMQVGELPKESARMAMAVLVAGPMLFVFPFFQKYFVKGLTVGSVKG